MFLKLYTVGNKSDFSEERPTTVQVNGISIGIFLHEGKFYAYENVCGHEGGPVGEGAKFRKIECEVAHNGKRVREYASETEFNIACPWHGVEYDIRTGISRASNKIRLRAFKVVVAKEGEVKVRV